MDHDDELSLHKAVNQIGRDQSNLSDIVASDFHLIRSVNENTKSLMNNQKLMAESLADLGGKLSKHNYDLQTLEQRMLITQAVLRADDLIHSFDTQVDKLHNSILFAKAGILDPYLVDASEMHSKIIMRELGYNVSLKGMDELLRKVKFSVISDQKAQSLIIIIRIPMAARFEFNVFECLVLPKIDDSIIVSLDGTTKYFAVSKDRKQYILDDKLDCFVAEDSKYICDGMIVRNEGTYPSCISNIFLKSTDKSCHYKRYLSNFDAHNRINGGLIVFSSTGLRVNLTCGSFTKSTIINGSSLISAPDQCEIESDKFNYKTSHFMKDVDLGNEAPSITCCSPFYNYVPSIEVKNRTIETKLFNLESIKSLDTETINTDLHRLKGIGKTYFPYFNDVSSESNCKIWTVLTIILIVCLYLTYKFQHLIMFCCSRRSNAPAIRHVREHSNIADRTKMSF